MANIGNGSAEPWSPYIGPIVMAGIAIFLVIDGGVASSLGGEAVARLSFATAGACAFGALGSLLYALWQGRSKHS